MTTTGGKGRKRKSPVEGFNNVPKILEEAKREVEAATLPERLGTEAAGAVPEPERVSSPPPKAALAPEKLGVRIKHRVPGRTRLEILQMKYNEPFARRVQERLAEVPGIEGIETSVVTASAVCYYNPAELRRPAVREALQAAWQDLFPQMQAEKLVRDMAGAEV